MENLTDFFASLNQWHWFGLALILLILEVVLGTSFFLLWVAVSAVTIGIAMIFKPELAWEYQFLIFAIEAASCLTYWYIYNKNKTLVSEQPNLNRRNEQFVGRVVTLGEPLINGRGRIQIDDSYWRVEGPDLPIGAAVKIIGVDGVVLRIEKVQSIKEHNMTVTIGSKVESFSALSNKGTINLSDYAGKYTVIYFYPKDNTPGCTTEAIDFKMLYSQFQAANAEIIGISRDSVESHTKFECQYELPFPLISDEDSKICEQFGVITNNMLLKGTPLGITRSTFLISPEGVLLQEWRNVKVADHAQAVLASIKAKISIA